MENFHEMRNVDGRVVAIYHDENEDEFRIVDGEREYFSSPDEAEDEDV